MSMPSTKLGSRDAILVASLAVLLAAIPFLLAIAATPAGGLYLGSTVSVDDHMVYAAWMHQAKSGHFFFDNRFTTASQPALTVHVYFFVLGMVAKVTGIPLASTLARLVFSFLFVLQLSKLIERLGWNRQKALFALLLAIFGGGIGFLVWHNFKGEITLPVSDILHSLMLGRLPADVKQPEAFVFPSMLVNGLFMVSMWLILVIFQAVIDAKDSAARLWIGCAAMAVLMNIHSYDVLLVGIVLFGVLVSELYQRAVSKQWILRTTAIVAGIVVPAAWFAYVLKSDTVFQARAATETFSLNFRAVFFGLLPLVLLGLRSIWPEVDSDKKGRLAWTGLILGMLILFVAAATPYNGYFLGWPAWMICFVASTAIVTFLSIGSSPARTLIISWAVLGLVAIYVPQLFQRKLAEGIVIPWAILATDGLFKLVSGREPSLKKLVPVACGILCGASSLRWLAQDLTLQKLNVSTTTVHAPFLNADEAKAIEALEREPGRKVVIAMPGVRSVGYESAAPDAKEAPDSFLTPTVNDLNPVASGLAGAYSVAGHWSETPDYLDQRKQVNRLFIRDMTLEETRSALAKLGVTHVLVRTDEVAPKNQNLRKAGTEIFTGKRLSVIRVGS